MLLPLPLSPTSAVIRARAQLEGDVVDGVHVRAAERSAEREALRQVADLERRNDAHVASPATRWHATLWPGSISRSTGRSVVCRT